ncbi:MAG: T9SS type A sorting domain-containing protein [Flavobacteriaceae bacterium]
MMKRLILFLFALKTWSQAPVITYPTNQLNFSVGQAITALSPINVGGIIPELNYGQVTTICGNGIPGATDANGNAASFNFPFGIACNGFGELYIADTGNNKIRKVNASYSVSSIAGNGNSGALDGLGINASFNSPYGIAVNTNGDVYVADYQNNKIRKINSLGVVSTFSGNGNGESIDGQGILASFNRPVSLTIDPSGSILVADFYGHKIRKITPNGNVTTIAGNGEDGNTDGSALESSFSYPVGVVTDASGNIFIADQNNHKIRKISTDGNVTTFAGSGIAGFADGTAATAKFNGPTGITIDDLNNLYVADQQNQRIRKISSGGFVSTVAGNGFLFNQDGIGANAYFRWPTGVTIDNTGYLYVADSNNYTIRKICLLGFSIFPDLPDGLIFNNSDGTITGTPTSVSPSATYEITAHNIYGESSTSLTIQTSLLTVDSFPDNVVQIYPNPTSNNLNIESPHGHVDEITITDLAGKIIFRTNENLHCINVKNLFTGIYFIRIVVGEHLFQSKFIKQ